MSSKSETPVDAPHSADVSVHFEGMVPPLQAEFERTSGATQIDLLHPQPQLLHSRVASVLHIIREVLPPRTRARVHITAQFADSIADLRPGRPPTPFDAQRGANIAMAKTIPALDGTFDIVINAALFINGPDETAEDLAEKTATLEHLAAHEPQHILTELDRTDSRFYVESVPQNSRGRIYRSVVAEAMDEYRCELAAGRYVPSGLSREGTMGDDLSHFRESLNASLRLSRSDVQRAATIAFTAAKEFFKANAYLAAERIAAGRGMETPVFDSKEWTLYGSNLWRASFDIFKSVPASDEPADPDHLILALTQLSELAADWMCNEVGVRYEINSEGHFCYWKREGY